MQPIVAEGLLSDEVASGQPVQLKGGRQLYASADGQFVIQGYLFQFKDGEALNLTDDYQDRWTDIEARRRYEYDHTGRVYKVGFRYKF